MWRGSAGHEVGNPYKELLEVDGVQCRRSLPGSIPLVGPACPVRASRRFASRCFHSCGQNWGRPSKGPVAPLPRHTEERLPLGETETSRCAVTLLAIHAADAYEEGDGSFQARHHTRLPRCEAIPSAPPHAAPPSATRKREDRLPAALVLVAD